MKHLKLLVMINMIYFNMVAFFWSIIISRMSALIFLITMNTSVIVLMCEYIFNYLIYILTSINKKLFELDKKLLVKNKLNEKSTINKQNNHKYISIK